MKKTYYYIQSAWGGETRSPAEIGRTFLATLDALAHIDPMIADWRMFDPRDEEGPGLPINATLRSNFASFVEANMKQDDWDRPDPDYGYLLIAGDDYLGSVPGASLNGTLLVSAGCKWAENQSEFELGGGVAPDPSAVTYCLYKPALLAIIAHWPAPWGCAICWSQNEQPAAASGDPAFPYSQYQMPWIGYLNAERAQGLIVPPELQSERTPDGGLIISAVTERLDPNNPDHMARSKQLAEIMIERGGNPGY